MALLDLKEREMELVLRLYLDRCDRKPLIWWYFNNGTGTGIKALHKGMVKTISLADLLDFFGQNPKIIEDRKDLVVSYQNGDKENG